MLDGTYGEFVMEKPLSAKTFRIDMPMGELETRAWAQPVGKEKAVLSRTSQVALAHADLFALFQGVYDAGLITDLDGMIMAANARAAQFFGLNEATLCTMHISDLVLGLSRELLRTVVDNLDRDQFTLVQAVCVRKDKTQFSAEISSSRIRVSRHEYVCFFVRDITARQEAEDALQKAHDRLEKEVAEHERANIELEAEIVERKRVEADLNAAVERLREHDRAKSQFVSNVSHELKTPLASISHAAGNMLKGIAGPVPEKAKEYLAMVRQDCQRLKGTVEDILDMSRAEANTLALRRADVQFGRFIERTAESLRMQIEAAELSLGVEIRLSKCFVNCDAQKMERVIFNVVKNAIKFNIRGGFVGVELAPADGSAGMAAVRIIDSGIGIDPKHLPHVTERFYRAGEYVSGAGLGLAICKEILERHGGTIAIESPPRGRKMGTMVECRLPLVDPPLALVLAREERVRYEWMRQLDMYGMRVAACGADDSGVAKAAESKPHVMLIDWSQPGIEGAVLIAKLKGVESLRSTPMVVGIGQDADGTREEILSGFEIPSMKWPWSDEALMACLDEMTAGRRRRE